MKTLTYTERAQADMKAEQQAAYTAARTAFAMPHWSVADLRKAEESAWRETERCMDRNYSVMMRLQAIRDELKARGERV